MKFVSSIVSKYCDNHIICLCLSVEHADNWQQRYPGCISTPCRTSTNVVTVEEPHLVSQSTDTRRCATHVCPRHTAKIQLSCHPCVYVHVLEESAEVRNTVCITAMPKGCVAPYSGHSSARVCQESFPPRTEHHRPRSPSNNLPRAKWEV